jgi:hypothetical protein
MAAGVRQHADATPDGAIQVNDWRKDGSYRLDGGSAGYVDFIVTGSTVEVIWCNRTPSLKTSLKMGRRLWYLYTAKGFRRIMVDNRGFLLNSVDLR